METKQRLTVASLWAFEDVAIKEIQNKFKVAHPDLDCAFDYSKDDHVIKVNGAHEEGLAGIASVVSKFIEEQKNKDLLDVPRIRQLDITTVLNDEGDSVEVTPDRHGDGKLVVIDSDSDEGLDAKMTKHWISSDGGLGCFARANREIFKAVASVTGTSIAINEDLKRVSVSGTNVGDVDDALAKLTRVEGPLSVPRSARTCNMLIVPHDGNMRLRIDNYSRLNDVALDRVLADIPSNTNIPISEMFCTVSLPLDPASQKYKVPENLLYPQSVGSEPGKSRIWSGFTFQEIGKGEGYIHLESIIEKNMGVAAPGVSFPHPYLSAEKAKQVNQWVADGTDMEQSVPDLEPSVKSHQDTDSTSKGDSSVASRSAHQEEKAPASATNKPRGLKSRKPVPGASGLSDVPGEPVASAEATEPPFPYPIKEAATPTRRMWKMVHESESAEVAASQEDTNLADANPASKGPPVGSVSTTLPHTPKGKGRHASGFDATRYGLNNTPGSAGTATRNSPMVQKLGDYQRATPRGRYGKRSALVDVSAPVTNSQANTQPLLAFDQPALVPQKPTGSPRGSNGLPQKSHSQAANMSWNDLLGIDFGCNKTMGDSVIFESDLESKSPSAEDSGINEQRLKALKMSLESDKQLNTTDVGLANKRPQGSKAKLRASVADLERPQKPEERQSVEELTTRQFYRTLQQKTPSPGGKPTTKTEKKAKRQATLEDAWGIPKPGAAKPVGDHPEQPTAASHGKSQSQGPDPTETESASKSVLNLQAENHTNRTIRTLFEGLKPSLDAAEYFQGILSLEAQIGLILVPLLPKTYDGGMISLHEWEGIFRSNKGLRAPTTKFINRVTTTGSDVDHIVDLKNSKSDSKSRLFEHEYSEYSVFYEYHCRTKADDKLVIVVDEQGRYSIKQPTAQLGTVNLHFPKQIWDSRVVLSGTSEHVAGSDPEVEEAVQYLVDNLWVQPDRTLIRIFTKLPEGKVFVIEKVLMKRWTRHRHVRLGVSTSKSSPAGVSSVPGKQHSMVSSGEGDSPLSKDAGANVSSAGSQCGTAGSSKDETPSEEKKSPTSQNDSNESQDVFLQVTEVQDLFIGICPSYSQAVRARSAGPAEMIRTGRQWYEVSLISPAIETILKSNSNLEIGEQTEEWRSSDLLGRDVSLVPSPSSSTNIPPAPSPVAAAIGAGGLGELFRLSQKVVEKMDGVGYWNGCAEAEAAEAPTLAPNPTATVAGKPPSPDKDKDAEMEPKSLDFEDIESVKDVDSVVAAPPAPPPPTPASKTVSVSAAPVSGAQFW